jgi:hypothetical protein
MSAMTMAVANATIEARIREARKARRARRFAR